MIKINEIHEKIQNIGTREYIEKLTYGKSVEIKRVGNSYRINPSICCGHRDCQSFDDLYPVVHCFSCGDAFNLIQIAISILGNFNAAINFIEGFIGEKVYFSKEDKAAIRLLQIRNLASHHYHTKMLADSRYLNYQFNTRLHSRETMTQYMVGKAEDYSELHNMLLEGGFTDDEIKEARIWIPEGLVVYPYIDEYGNCKRFNTKNPFKVHDKDGQEIKGFATGTKAFYTSRNVDNSSVIICEGENDLISLVEAGAVSVIATGGTPSVELINKLRRFNRVYCMFDNDEAGEIDTRKVNELLPDVAIYRIKYDNRFKDPDEYYKKNPYPILINDLIENAELLENNKYYIKIDNNELSLKNRNYSIRYKLKEVDNKGNFKGDFYLYGNGQDDEIKFNVSIDKIGKKYTQFVEPIYEALYKYYNDELCTRDVWELINIYRFSIKKDEVIKSIAEKVNAIDGAKDRQDLLGNIESSCGGYLKELILKELNNIENVSLDPDISYPFMPASQAFDLNKNRAYMYFNLAVRDDEGIKIVPALLTNDKRVLRLDYYKRKSSQHLLLIDGAFQLHEEVPTAIMTTETCSLKSKYAKKFIDGEISTEDIKPTTILREMEEYFRCIYYSEEQVVYKILALFAYSTYFYQLFGVTPYLFLNAEKGSGKSLLSSLLSKLCFCCRYTVGTTESALFRTISNCGGTIILDEMENLTSRDKTADSLMASILKSGYAKNTGNTLRTNTETKAVEEFSIFSPKIISNIYGIEDVVEDRCLKIPMKKYPSSITNRMMNIKVFENFYKDKIEETASKACISALTYFSKIYDEYVSMHLDMGSARNSQIMRPIFTLAAIAGEDYEKAVLEYYSKYMEDDKKWVEANSPEGCLKEVFKIIAEEVKTGSMEWLDKDSLATYCKSLNESEFTTNTFVIKLLLDQIDGQRTYSMSEVHKLIKRVYPAIELKNRTSISIACNENWVKLMRNQSKVAVYTLNIRYDNFIVKSNKLEDNLY
jgi:DNA primase